MVAGGYTDDVSFTLSTSTYKFKLARDKNGWPIYHRRLAKYLGNSTPGGRVTTDSTDPEKLLIREQVSFSKGFGQTDFEDAAYYYDATDCEATVPGRVYLGPASTSESAIVPTITNGGFETALGAEWSATGARTSTWPNEGSYELTCDAGESGAQVISWTTAYRSKQIVVTAAAMPMATGGTGTLTVSDGIGSTVATATFTAGSGTIANGTGGTIGYGSATDGTGSISGSPVNLTTGANTLTATGNGNITILLNAGVTGTAESGGGGATVTGSPVALVAGSNTITITMAGSNQFTVTTVGTPSGVLSAGANTVHLSDGAGQFTVTLPIGVKGTAASGTCTLTGSPITLAEGNQTITGVTAVGNITITLSAGTYKGISVAHTLDATATELQITVAGVAQQCLFDSVKIAYPNKLCEFGGSLYQARGARLEKWNGTNWTTNTPVNFLHEIADLNISPSSGADYLAVSFGGSYAAQYSTDAATFSVNTSQSKPYLFGLIGATLYGKYAANSIATYNPATGAWGSTVSFGSTAYSITKIVDHPDTVYVVKTDSLWKVVSGAAVLMMDLKSDYHANTGKNAYHWHNDLFVPTNLSFYRLVDADTVTNITPSNYGPISSYRYRVAAIAGDGEYLTVIMSDATDAYILRGHYVTVDGDAGWYWHPVRKVTGLTAINDAVIFSDSGVLKLFIAAQPGASWLYHWADYGTRAHLTDGMAVATGTFTTSKHYGNFRGDNKAFYSITFGAGGLLYDDVAPTNYAQINVQYSIDGAAFVNLGTTVTSSTPQTMSFASGTKGKSIQFKFTLTYTYGDVDGPGPYLEWYSWEGQLLPTSRRSTFEMMLDVSSSTVTLGGVTKSCDTKKTVANLKTLIENGFPVTFNDVLGDTYYVSFTDHDDQPGPADDRNKRDHRFLVQLQEAKWTAP